MHFDWDRTFPLLMAGALGGLVRWLTLRTHWTDGVIAIVVGAVCALYLSPLVLPILAPALAGLNVDATSMVGFSGFVAGIGGMSLAGLLIDILRLRTKFLTQRADAPPATPGEKP